MGARETPVMKQHSAAKRAYPDAVLFFRLGDFYEMFGDDAVLVARLLDLTLTSRNKGKPDEVPMAGVPHHAAHGYIARLLEHGHKVAICEQMADPSKVKGIVPRQVVRVITPGTVTDQDQLAPNINNWLCSVHVEAGPAGMALLDLSTGELSTAVVPDLTALLSELSHAAPRELLLGFGAEWGSEERSRTLADVRRTLPRVIVREDDDLDPEAAPSTLGSLAKDASRLAEAGRLAVARVLRFAHACHPDRDLPIKRLSEWDPSRGMLIDPVAQTHLELVESLSGNKAATLLGTLDRTLTPAGGRLLRRRLVAPLMAVEKIRRRLDLVELFVVHSGLRDRFRAEARGINDLERLVVRICLGEATPRDLGALRDGLLAAGRASSVLQSTDDPALRETLGLESEVDVVGEIAELYAQALVERPPAQSKDGGVFQAGFDTELDELSTLKTDGTKRIVEYEQRIKEATGIQKVKVRFTRVFGWYVEVSRGQAKNAPDDWRRKQTVAAGERYTTDELDVIAEAIESAGERHRERELALIEELVEVGRKHAERVRVLAERMARWDVAAALAEVAHDYDYCRPDVNDGECIEIHDGRHPVVERLAAQGRFVPNDVSLDASGERLWLVTGPNMAGKSTLLRQVALIVIMAQLGSYVPAASASIGMVDRVLSRVGASDNLAGGESTFMVEMRETAQILRRASARSLVILDEIGRGTSTFDGLAIAWAVAEYLDEVIACRALFATHYHELTRLGEDSEHAANYSVSAREMGDDIVFLHRLTRGAASRSYGVFVARLAGVPEAVLGRADALLKGLEAGAQPAAQAAHHKSDQLDLFAPANSDLKLQAVVDELRAIDVDRLSGLEALQWLARVQRKLANDDE